MKISEDIKYIGVNDHDIDLFEGQYDVPLGMAYNSYVILDEKTAVMDTVDGNFADEWLKNLKEALGGRTPDYLVIHHMEPDHSACIEAFVKEYPETEITANAQAFRMLSQFYPSLTNIRKKTIANNEKLSLGKHELTFIFAPMVHWPEVMMSYDSYDKVLFSADAFGKFGANDVEDPEGWACEARRYYFGIVGKYGAQTQAVLKKAAALDIQTICSLHGPVLTKDLSVYLNLYDKWSSYQPEEEGIFIAYASIYGHTKEAAYALYDALKQGGYDNVHISDLAREDMYECVEDAFRYSKLVLASVTYDTSVMPCMREFISHLTHRGYKNRTVAFIENGTWAPMAAKAMKTMLEGSQNLTYLEPVVSIKSAVNEQNKEEIAALSAALKN
jgi:flavorubredoxin